MALIEAGKLWKKESEKGKYLSGTITIDGKAYPIVIFPNKFKKEDKHPDFRINLKVDDQPKPEDDGFGDTPEDNTPF